VSSIVSAQNAVSEFRMKADKTLRHYGRETMAAARSSLWNVFRWPAVRPVFIVSGSRSGTQMLYKTLSASREIGSLHREIYALWWRLHPPANKNWDTHALDASDASRHDREFIARYFFAQTGSGRFIDKNNQHGLCVPYLHALFPDARFIYIKRNPGDTLNSMIEGWGKPERFATWSTDLPETVAIEGGRYTRWCFFLAEGWRSYLRASIEEVCAFQYRSIHRAILDGKRHVPADQWIEVFYEDLVKNPVEGFRRLFEYCELVFTPALERRCADVLSNPYDAFSEIRLEKWRDQENRNRIEHVFPQVAEVANEMGYSI
jgi:hypothetical protein